MAQSGYTPIKLYYSTTVSAAPSAGNLANGELAINITDGKLYYKDNGGVVQVIATKGAGTIGGSNTQVQYNSSGALAGSANLTFNGTTLTANTLNLTNALGVAYGGTGLTSGTSGGVLYYSASGTLASSSALAASAIVLGGGAGVAPATTTTGTGVVTAVGNNVNTTGGLVTQSGTLAASALLLGGGSGSAITSTTTGTGVVTALGVNTGTAGAFVVNGGALGTPSSGTVTNLTGTASININGTVGATTPTTGAFTTISASGVSSFADGTVGAPGITFTSDTDSGIYRIGANNIGIGVNGAKVLDIGTTGLGVTGNITNANQVITASNSSTALEINHSGSGQQGLNLNLTNASYAGTAIYLNTTRAANGAFDLINLSTNGTARFRVSGNGGIVSTPASGVGIDVTGASANYALSATANASTSSQAAIFTLQAGSTSTAVDIWDTNTSGDNRFLQFFTEGSATLRGSITYNRGGGVVAYNTTSDYRAKTIYGPLQDTGAVIDALKVYRGKMNGATVERPMLIAHEAQAVVPYAVNGEKDELDEKGQPKYQTMDHQILVPLLIAEVQALRARVAALEAK